MRKEYSKNLRNLFAKEIKQTIPDFKETKIKSIYFTPGDRAYKCVVNEDLYFWLVLSPSPKDLEEFNILIGWSKLGRYPELSMVPSIERPSKERKEFLNEEYLTRLPYLWTTKDEWWVIKKYKMAKTVEKMQALMVPFPPEEAKNTVEPFVKDSIRKIVEYGMPYLEELKNYEK